MAIPEQITNPPVMTDRQAFAVLRAAEAKARETGGTMVIAVVDAAGELKALTRMDGAPEEAIEWTIDRAFTAAAFRMPTRVLASSVLGPPAVVASTTSLAHVLTPGGHPLVLDGTVVGGIGVFGGSTPDDDGLVAEAGLAAIDAEPAEDGLTDAP